MLSSMNEYQTMTEPAPQGRIAENSVPLNDAVLSLSSTSLLFVHGGDLNVSSMNEYIIVAQYPVKPFQWLISNEVCLLDLPSSIQPLPDDSADLRSLPF